MFCDFPFVVLQVTLIFQKECSTTGYDKFLLNICQVV